MDNPTYSPNETLNRNISFDEINRLVFKTKSKSASGYDGIPYGVLKSQKVIETLTRLFQLILDTSIVPSVWRKAIICPILKDASTDPRIPMNYRGVSLLSCISKIYSAFINQRITSHLDEHEVLADEQNGFRKTGRVKITYSR